MAVELASAYVTVIPTTKGIAAGLEKELVGPLNAAAKKGADEAGATMKKSLDDTGKSFTKFGIGGLAVAGALGAGLLATGKSASDLGESINAVQVTFGKSAAGILKLGEDAATSVGLSNAAFNGLAVQFSAFATTIAGKGGDVVGTMKEMTGRAADFASVMNIDVAEAARLFQSGLAGETEPLKKFGIDLSAAAVSAFAASHGIGEMGKELTESEKVTARYQLLMASTAKTQGDFANTSDSAANSTRIAKAQLENASASLGAAFTPAMAFAATTVGSLAEKFVGLNDATGGWLAKGAGIAVIALGAASGISLIVGQAIKLHDRFGLLKGAFTNAEGGLKTFGLTARTATLALGVLGIATVAATLFYAANAKKKAELVAVTNEFVDALNAEEDGQRGAIAAAVAKGLSDQKLIDQAAKLGLSVKDLAKIVNGEVVPAYAKLQKSVKDADLTAFGNEQETFEAFDFVNSKLSILNDGLEDAREQMKATATVEKELGTATEETADSTGELTDQTDLMANATKLADDVIKGFAAATEEAKKKSDAFAESLVTQREKTEDLYGREFDAIQAKHDLADATVQADADVAAMNETLKSHKAGTEEATTATRSAYDSIVDVAEQYGTLNGAALSSDSSIRRQIDSLTLQASTMAPGSPLRVMLEQYIAELAAIPSNVSTILDLHISTGQVTTAAGDVIGLRPIGGKVQYGATGGWREGMTVVGEEGPELVDFKQPGFIHTAAQTRAMRSASSTMAAAPGMAPLIGTFNNNRRDIGVGDLNQILAMARLAA